MNEKINIKFCDIGFGILLESVEVNKRELNIEKIIQHINECKECKKLLSDYIENIELPLPAKLLINNILTK